MFNSYQFFTSNFEFQFFAESINMLSQIQENNKWHIGINRYLYDNVYSLEDERYTIWKAWNDMYNVINL